MKFTLTVVFSILFISISVAQSTNDTTAKPLQINGSAAITNNGISIIPTFSLNAPAMIFNFYINKNRFSFDPDIRATFDGRKGSMIFWFRYKLIQDKKFTLGAGIHPAYNLALKAITENGSTRNITQASRFIAYELNTNYKISDHISVGPYALRGMGLQSDGPKSSYFLALNTNFTNLPIGNHFMFSWTPQFYYLYIDKTDGFYLANNFKISHDKSPFSLQSIMNKEIKTDITGSKNFTWNIILSYSFGNSYIKK